MSDEKKKICPSCGSKEDINAKFCTNCGASFEDDGRNKVPSQKSFAILLVVVLAALVVSMIYNIRLLNKASGKEVVHQQEAMQNPHATQQAVTIDENKIKEFEDHIKAHPGDPAPVVDLANYYFDHGMFDKAIAYYENALVIRKDQPEVWIDKGVAHFNLRQLNEAEDCFKKALQFNPAHPKALYNLGIVYHMKNDMQKLVEVWQELIQKAPDSPEAKQAMRFLDQMMNRNDG